MPGRNLAIYSANIYTGMPDKPWAQALGMEDGKIKAVGSNQEVKDAMPDAEALELSGRMVTPGLTDAHCHFISMGQSLMMVDLRNLTSLEECRRRIKQAAAKLEPGQWLLGRAWNHHMWQEAREPNRHDMDDIVPDNPAMMVRACGHSQWLNTKGLETAGIVAGTPDPSGGKIDRDENGQPTGMLREARRVVIAHVPPPTNEYLKKACLLAQERALASGLTCVHTYESLAEWRAFSELEQEGKLKLRVHHNLQHAELEEMLERGMHRGYGSERLWVGQMKLFADGSLGANTALLFEPYCDDPGNCGLPFTEPEVLKERVALCHKNGFSVAIHAIGDKAVSNSLDAISHGRKEYPGQRRDSVDHVQICRTEDLERFKKMDVVASVQPVFIPTDWNVASTRWGAERCEAHNAYAWKTIQDMGIRMQFGSDTPVEPIEPLLGLQAAVLRQTTGLEPEGGWRPQERMTLEEALDGFTRTAAWVEHKEGLRGVLQPGALADLTVFGRDLSQTPPEEWPQIPIEYTIIDGEVVYQK